jgi:23S rRNA (pseudouridine1915-N3)-methyltransferase
MQITLAHVGTRLAKGDPCEAMTQMYLQRTAGFVRCDTEAFKSEAALWEWLDKRHGRTPAIAVLLDSRGKQMSSEVFAVWLGERRDEGAQQIIFAIGAADGWSETARRRARLLLSLGTFTMAHALARLVMAEQLYRACTILAGHPYHSGH